MRRRGRVPESDPDLPRPGCCGAGWLVLGLIRDLSASTTLRSRLKRSNLSMHLHMQVPSLEA